MIKGIKTFNKKMKFGKYFIGGVYLNAPVIFDMVLSLIIFPIILGNIASEDYGLWQLILSLHALFVAFSAPNITSATKRGVARGLKATLLYGFFKRFRFMAVISILILLASVFFMIYGSFMIAILLVISAVYLSTGYLYQNMCNEFFIAEEDFKRLAIITIIMNFFSSAGSAIVAYLTKNVIYYVLFQLGSFTIISLGIFLWIIHKHRLLYYYKMHKYDTSIVKYGIKLMPLDILSIINSNLSNYIIGPFFGFTALAVYSVANKFWTKITGIAKSLRSIIYSDFARIETRVLIARTKAYLFKAGLVSLFASALMVAAVWLYVYSFLPKTYIESVFYFALLAAGLPAGILSIILKTVLESHLKSKELMISETVSNVFGIILLVVLGYFFGVAGLCVATTLRNWFSLIVYYRYTIILCDRKV